MEGKNLAFEKLNSMRFKDYLIPDKHYNWLIIYEI